MKTEPKSVQSRFRAPKTTELGALHQNIVQKTATPIAWMADRLVVDAGTLSTIGELYGDYEAYCLTRHAPTLPRKTWIAAMKLAGFETQSGAFVGLAIQ